MSAGTMSRPAAGVRWAGVAGYVGLLLAGVGLFLVVRAVGGGLTAPPPPPGAAEIGKPTAGSVDVVLHVTATLAAVIASGFALGRLLRMVGQPPVIGEVLAGILLGPSLLGAVWPEAMHLLVPPASVDPKGQVPAALKAVSQLGVILYMFLVGLELNAARLTAEAPATLFISHASIVLPFALGAGLAIGLYPVYSHAGVPFTSFALFLGVAMAITAFPVLARILSDIGREKTELGGVALAAAAAGDVTAWCLLALVVGVARQDVGGAGWVIGGAAGFVVLMLVVARPLLVRVTRALDSEPGPLPAAAIPATFLGVLLCALATEAIGVHALFGAFVLGAILPHNGRLADEFAAKLKDPVTVLLLPAFFAFTGLRTEIGLVSGWQDWLWCAGVIVVATVGKIGGTLLAARLVGRSWRDSAVLGVLMNTRGLMELIVLNVGLDMGVIEPRLFAILVLMALVTTAMTAPLLKLIVRDTDTWGR